MSESFPFFSLVKEYQDRAYYCGASYVTYPYVLRMADYMDANPESLKYWLSLGNPIAIAVVRERERRERVRKKEDQIC